MRIEAQLLELRLWNILSASNKALYALIKSTALDNQNEVPTLPAVYISCYEILADEEEEIVDLIHCKKISNF